MPCRLFAVLEVFRQASQSRIDEGQVPDLVRPEPGSNFYFVASEDPEQAVERVLAPVGSCRPRSIGLPSIRDIKMLCLMNQGEVGMRSPNAALQTGLKPTDEPRLAHFGGTFARVDKLMQIENDRGRELYDRGFGSMDRLDPEEGELVARFAT